VPPPTIPYGQVIGGGGNSGYGGTGYVDPEDPEGVKGFDFSDQSIRRGFIRKVYSILMVSR
jgi:protein lifeguard